MFFSKLRRRCGTRQQFDRQKIMACRWNKMICAKGAGESAFQPKRAAKNGSWKASIVICATNKVASVGGLLCTMASLDVASWHLGDMATGPDDVRFQGKTGSSRPTTKMTRLTQLRHANRTDQGP
jgi:hypothetical protein